MLRNHKNTIIIIALLFSLFYSKEIFGKQIVDALGNTYETTPGDPSLVKFIRIRGKKVLVFEDLKNREIIQQLQHKQFVQFLEKNGKYYKVRVYNFVGIYEGWINKFKVYNTKGIIKFYFGKPFLMESDEEEIDPNDIEFEVNKTAWIMKDTSQLLELPKEDSDVKFDLYFGKELYLKRQKADYYMVEIRNDLKDETITGWVRTEDVGNKEFYYAKYDKTMAEYTRKNNSLATEISELEAFIVELNQELEDLENEHQILIFQKEANSKILANSTNKRNNYLQKEMKIAEEIEESVKRFQREIISLRSKIDLIDKEISNSSNSLFEINAENRTISKKLDQYKIELPSILPKLRAAYEKKKTYYLAHKEEIDRKIAEQDIDPLLLNQCKEFENEYKSKLAEFEKVKAEMSEGDISKEKYEILYESYTNLWNEASLFKKKFEECKFNASSKHKAIYNEAIGLKREDELDDALELFLEAVKIKDDFEEAYFQIVLILIELDEDYEIDKYIYKVTDAEKKGQLFYRRAYNEKNNYPKKAIKYYSEMAKSYKPNLAFYQIGLIYSEKLSDQTNAIKYFKKSIQKDSKDPKVYEALGAAILDTKPPKGQSKETIINEAISYFEKGIKYGNGYKNLHTLCARLAQAYNELGKATSALKYADMAINNAPKKKIAAGFLEKGIALIKMDKKKEAEIYLNKAKKDLMTKEQATFWLKEIKK
ncbi:MAG: hypothetical protein PF638_13805 [Candidatus Delongbacteria bacterium]|jgi:hypothetical protein|nr:hypothetical protein [Candidatus Delongbacteria bacterium]